MIGTDHCVAAQAGAGRVASVLEIIEQAFFAHEALSERHIAFLVLGGDAAFWIHAEIADVEAPRRRQFAKRLSAAEDGVKNIEYGLVLENSAVATLPKKGIPRRQGEPIPGQATIGSL